MGSGPAAGTVRARYLVYFQYVGTDFNGVAAVRGAQRAVGVQNYLEEAAERLKSVVPVKFVISSRTDAGVHALSNAAHLDVQRRSGQPPFSPEVLTQALNTHLKHPAIRPSVCTATSMPATRPHPGPTCTAWPPAAPGLTSCLCLNETDAGLCGQIIWMWPPCRRPPNTSWGLMTSAPSSRLAAHPLAQCAHCAEPQCPLTQPAPLSSPRRAGEEGSLHAGLEAVRAGLSCSTFPGKGRAEAGRGWTGGSLCTCWGHAGQSSGAHEPAAVPSPQPEAGDRTENAPFVPGLTAYRMDLGSRCKGSARGEAPGQWFWPSLTGLVPLPLPSTVSALGEADF